VLMDRHILRTAMGKEPADLVVTNGRIVSVYTGEIYPGGVAVSSNRITAVGDVSYAAGDNTEVIDAEGKYLTPGFIDGHIHPESSNLSMTSFAEIALCHGTTSVFTDLHEIGVVGGIEAMRAALEEGKKTPLKYYWVVPSHIPFSPGLETSGGHINAEIIEEVMKHEDSVGLSEVVSLYVAFEHPDLMKSLDITQKNRKIICGHGPETSGPMWNAFAAAGVTNDHEALSAEDVLLRLRTGVHAMLRHNLVVPTLPPLIKAVTEHKIDTRMVSLCTDDTTAIMLATQGHMDYLVRLALEQGIDFMTAIQMVSLNIALAFHRDYEIGSLAPGRYADINIVEGPQNFKVLRTIAGGKVVAENHKLFESIPKAVHKPVLLNTFHLKSTVEPADLVIPAKKGARTAHVHIMRTLPHIPITEGGEADLPVKEGYIAADKGQDLLHISVIERHHKTGNIGKAFLGGMGLKRGAMASSIGHDHHNIVVTGVDPVDMAFAANRVVEMQGGIVLAENNQIIEEISFPILGLLTDMDAWSLAEKRTALLNAAKDRGCTVSDAFMFLSFITLAAIPAFAITDRGYVDVSQQKKIDPVLSFS
jgi:adenine deaminase